ncbi:hypothetical protein V6N13_084288 [Hibiscus sabdariffa]
MQDKVTCILIGRPGSLGLLRLTSTMKWVEQSRCRHHRQQSGSNTISSPEDKPQLITEFRETVAEGR